MSTFPKMDPEQKQKWVAALRSGKYQQAREAFCAEPSSGLKHCCLAVFIDAVIGQPVTTKDYTSHFGPTFEKHKIPRSHLVQLNDTEMLTFNEIADWIEENL